MLIIYLVIDIFTGKANTTSKIIERLIGFIMIGITIIVMAVPEGLFKTYFDKFIIFWNNLKKILSFNKINIIIFKYNYKYVKNIILILIIIKKKYFFRFTFSCNNCISFFFRKNAR